MKKILAIFLVITLAICMSSCKKKAEESVSSASNFDTPVTLTVWESTNGPDQFIKQAGAAYTALHPNITIEYVNVELNDADDRIAIDGPAGIGADIFAASHDTLGKLVAGGHVLPTVNAEEVKSAVLGACVQAVTYDGTLYGYPISAETYALFYNKALISTPPKTWEDVAAFCEGYNNGDKYGFVMDVANAYYTVLFTTSDGNRIFGADGTDSTAANLNSAASAKGLTFFASLRSILDIPAATLTTRAANEMFQSGQAAMHISGPWNVKNFIDAGLDFGVAPLPSLPGDMVPASSFSGTRVMYVSAYTKHPTLAADFAAFLISPEMQALRMELTGALPSIDIPSSSPHHGGFIIQLDYAFPMPSVPTMGDFWGAMGAASANIWDGADVKAELEACGAILLGE